jgi:hypothetical protein
VNSDDPAYFGGYMNDNFIATFEALPLGLRTRSSWRATASPPPSSMHRPGKKYLDEVDAYFAAFNVV